MGRKVRKWNAREGRCGKGETGEGDTYMKHTGWKMYERKDGEENTYMKYTGRKAFKRTHGERDNVNETHGEENV